MFFAGKRNRNIKRAAKRQQNGGQEVWNLGPVWFVDGFGLWLGFGFGLGFDFGLEEKVGERKYIIIYYFICYILVIIPVHAQGF